MQHWLVKQEPEKYPWTQFVKDKGTYWDGVRNYQARNNLRAMKKGDLVMYYHSVSEKAVVGVAKITREAYPDPTAKEGDWSGDYEIAIEEGATLIRLGTTLFGPRAAANKD